MNFLQGRDRPFADLHNVVKAAVQLSHYYHSCAVQHYRWINDNRAGL